MRPYFPLLIAAILGGSSVIPAAADNGAALRPPPPGIRGFVTDSTGTPLANARVTLVPTGRVATSGADGGFVFRSVPAGSYHLDASLIGYAPGHAEVDVPAEGDEVVARIVLVASPLALEGVIVTGTPGASDPLTVAQSSTQMSGRELDRQLGSTVAATLEREPGITSRYAGPAAALPVIRGLTGERVVMLENGQRTGDLAGSSADHALSVDPLAASRLEVVRGPASLLYGSGALGGVVNVIGTDIPTNVPARVEGYAAGQGMSVTPGGAGSGQILLPLSERLVGSVRGGGRSAGDVRVGDGTVLANTALRNLNGGAGIGYVSDQATGGVAVNAHTFHYGVPFGEDGGVDLDGERYEVKARGGYTPGGGAALRSVDVAGSAQWYSHDEIEPDGAIGTTFILRTQTADLRADTDLDRFRGTVGVSGLFRQYEPTGEEALTPFARHANVGVFIYQEAPLVSGDHESELVPHIQLGGRYDGYSISTQSSEAFGPGRDRSFGAFSGSVGLNFPFPQGVSLGVSAARAFRAPSVDELFADGVHVAANSYDVGNPDLDPEMNEGVEGMLRAHTRTVTALASAYYNHIDGYIAPEAVGDTAVARDGETVVLPLNRYVQGNASLVGAEGKVEVLAGRALVLGARGDWVRGRFHGGAPLPYMPAGRLGGDVRWDDGRFSAALELTHAFAQGEVPEHELATEAYTLVDASLGYTRSAGGLVHSLLLRADNLTDAVYRDATSRIKELVPNPGRNISLVYRVLF